MTMENEFKFSKDFARMFQEAKKIGNLDRCEEIFNELCAEVGHANQAADMSSATAGKRLAELLNSKENGTSFEGSVPGKKI